MHHDLLQQLRDYLVVNMKPGNDLAPKFIEEIDAALEKPVTDEMVKRVYMAAWKIDLPLTREEVRTLLSALTEI